MSQSLDRALQALAAIAQGQTTLNELSESLGVHRTTALRLLHTLEKHRFVFRPDPRHYQLGSGLFALANEALESRDVRQIARPYMVKLAKRHGHTLHLAVYESGDAVYVEKVDGMHPLRMYSRVGDTAPLHCTAVGKLLLAAQPAAERRRVAGSIPYPSFTPNTIGDAGQLLDELEKVRTQGYATAKAEHEDFLHCVAAPITDHSGAVVAAVSMSVAAVAMDGGEVERYLPSLLEVAREISRQHGAA